jgi:hypothetical protein
LWKKLSQHYKVEEYNSLGLQEIESSRLVAYPSMRNFIDIVESKAWPATISGLDLSMEVEKLHHTPGDFIDGDIDHNITAFGNYELKRVSLSEIKRGIYIIYDDLVKNYAEEPSSAAPPIVLDAQYGLVLDGNHRVEAAVKRGEHDILAYVGNPSTYNPVYDDDEDEWQV